MLLQLFLRIIIYRTLTYNWNACYRSWEKWQCMADEPHEVGISLKCSTNLFCSTCNALWPQTDFFNIVHLSAIERHVNCTFLNCFYTYLQLEMAISVFILIFSHIFICVCFSSILGVVIWHARWAPFPHGEAFHWYGSKIISCSMYTFVFPQNIFSTSWIW